MNHRSAADELDLVIFELENLLESNPTNPDLDTGKRYNRAVIRAEAVLDDDFEHLKLSKDDTFTDPAYRSHTVVLYKFSAFQYKAKTMLACLQSRRDRPPAAPVLRPWRTRRAGSQS